MDNPEKLTTFGKQDTGQINVREGHSKIDNREKLTTFGKQDEQSKKTQHNMCSTRICANKHK